MIEFKAILKQNIYDLLHDSYPISLEDIEISYTPQIKMGDLALAFPFRLAKK